MNENPLISVIIPVYNAGKYLSQCIDSILNQTFNEWELILINDGSIDDSPFICDNFKNIDKRIIVIHKQNEGVGRARNDGIVKAKGVYLCFVDADDWLNKTTLEIALQASNNNILDLIQFGCVRFAGDNKILSRRISPDIEINLNKQSKSNLIPLFDAGNAFAVWGKLIKRTVIIENDLWFRNKKRGQDIDFTIRAYEYFVHIKGISDCLYNYRVLYDISSKYDSLIIENHNENYIQFYNLFKDCAHIFSVQNYLVKLYVLWFTLVIPINISSNKKLSRIEKKIEFKRLFQSQEAREIYLKFNNNNLTGRYKILCLIYSLNSPFLLFVFSSIIQKVRNKFNLTN
jgi:glycosyltransferase involved in cell wall biosynthesis